MNKTILVPKRVVSNSFLDNCLGTLNSDEVPVGDNVPLQFLGRLMANETIKNETQKILREIMNSRKPIAPPSSLNYATDCFQENNAEALTDNESKIASTEETEPIRVVRYEQKFSDTLLHSKNGLPLLMAFKSYGELNHDPNILKTGIFSRREYDIPSISGRPFSGKKSFIRKLSKDKVNEDASSGTPPSSAWITVKQWYSKMLNIIGDKASYIWDLVCETTHMRLLVQFGMLIVGVSVLYSANLIGSPNRLIQTFFSILLPYLNIGR